MSPVIGETALTRPARGQVAMSENRAMEQARFEYGMDGPRSILVGIDSSETAMHAAAYAAGLARRQGTHLIALHVVSTSSVSAQMAATAGMMLQVQDEITEDLRRTLLDGAARIGLSAEFVVRRGNPYKELVGLAHERRVDAIVVGASTQSGRRLVGSLAGRLVRDAAWPVTVVP